MADPPMGVVSGKIKFKNKSLGYEFVKNYCETHNIVIESDYPDEKLISTSNIDSLVITNTSGIKINALK